MATKKSIDVWEDGMGTLHTTEGSALYEDARRELHTKMTSHPIAFLPNEPADPDLILSFLADNWSSVKRYIEAVQVFKMQLGRKL